jgi:hypothetical protein
MSDEESVKILQPVSLAMREAVLHLDTHQFGENRARNKRKSEKNNNQSVEKIRKKKRKKNFEGGIDSVRVKNVILERDQKLIDLPSSLRTNDKKPTTDTKLRTKKSKKVKSKLSAKKVKKKSSGIS